MMINKNKLGQAIFGRPWDRDLYAVDEVLSTLTDREQQILRLRFSGKTFKQISAEIPNLNDTSELISSERARAIVAKALRKLRHPSRSRPLMGKLPLERIKKVEFIEPSICKSKELCLTDINTLDFSVRTTNCLRKIGIKTVAELASKNKTELMQISNFGRKSFNEVKYVLDEL